MPANKEQSYDDIIETIRGRARERTPRRAYSWIRFVEENPEGSQQFLIRTLPKEDVAAASRYAEKTLTPRITKQEPITLNFEGIQVCTQSYAHALLYFPLRMAWALKTPIHVINAKPAVRSTLELLENYALGG